MPPTTHSGRPETLACFQQPLGRWPLLAIIDLHFPCRAAQHGPQITRSEHNTHETVLTRRYLSTCTLATAGSCIGTCDASYTSPTLARWTSDSKCCDTDFLCAPAPALALRASARHRRDALCPRGLRASPVPPFLRGGLQEHVPRDGLPDPFPISEGGPQHGLPTVHKAPACVLLGSDALQRRPLDVPLLRPINRPTCTRASPTNAVYGCSRCATPHSRCDARTRTLRVSRSHSRGCGACGCTSSHGEGPRPREGLRKACPPLRDVFRRPLDETG